jgi:hypothetical protein
MMTTMMMKILHKFLEEAQISKFLPFHKWHGLHRISSPRNDARHITVTFRIAHVTSLSRTVPRTFNVQPKQQACTLRSAPVSSVHPICEFLCNRTHTYRRRGLGRRPTRHAMRLFLRRQTVFFTQRQPELLIPGLSFSSRSVTPFSLRSPASV